MSEKKNLIFVGHLLTKLKSLLFRKDVLSFLVFLALSFAFWFINMLDKERETTLVIPVRYSGLSQQYNVASANTNFLKVQIKDKGINLLDYTNINSNPVTIDVSQNLLQRGKVVWNKDELRFRLMKYLLPTSVIIDIKPDSLAMVYEQLASKKLPVETDGEIEPAQQYMLSRKTIVPSYVTVFATKTVLEKLTTVKTEKFSLKNIDKTQEHIIKLHKTPGVRYSNEDVKLSITAEMFTEKEMFFPVKVINCPPELIIRTFPVQLKAVFNVALSHFKSVSVNDIVLYIDYNRIIQNKVEKQPVLYTIQTSMITNVRLESDEVEFIIEKK